jgi:hypothetical protein
MGSQDHCPTKQALEQLEKQRLLRHGNNSYVDETSSLEGNKT